MTSAFDSFTGSPLKGFQESLLHERDASLGSLISLVVIVNESFYSDAYYTEPDIYYQDLADYDSIRGRLAAEGYGVQSAVAWLTYRGERIPIAPEGVYPGGGMFTLYQYGDTIEPGQLESIVVSLGVERHILWVVDISGTMDRAIDSVWAEIERTEQSIAAVFPAVQFRRILLRTPEFWIRRAVRILGEL